MKNQKSSRREFIKTCSAAACCLASCQRLLPVQEAAPYAPFQVGVQSFCFRKFTFDEALAKTRELGLKFIEVYPGHLKSDITPDEMKAAKAKLDAIGVKISAYGVCGFSKDHEKNRALFAFAKEMGIENLSANPAYDSFDSLNELVEEFQINIAIHNHGPKALYSTDEDIRKAVEGRSKRIGLCIDTGHFARSDVNPIAVALEFGPRVHGVHLKDTKDKKDCVVGKGDFDLIGFLRALVSVGFTGYFSLEYESDPENPLPAMQECLVSVQAAVKRLNE